MIKKRATLFALSFLFAHDPDNEKIVIDDFIRIGFVSNAEIAQNGLGSFYRLKRVTNNTFRDLKMYAHFFDSRSELKMRVKSSNKYDFNSNLYHFTTYSYHKSGNNLRYHFNQGVGFLLRNTKKGNFTSEVGWAYDKSDFIDSDEKTTYIKSAISYDQNFEKLKIKLEPSCKDDFFFLIPKQSELMQSYKTKVSMRHSLLDPKTKIHPILIHNKPKWIRQ